MATSVAGTLPSHQGTPGSTLLSFRLKGEVKLRNEVEPKPAMQIVDLFWMHFMRLRPDCVASSCLSFHLLSGVFRRLEGMSSGVGTPGGAVAGPAFLPRTGAVRKREPQCGPAGGPAQGSELRGMTAIGGVLGAKHTLPPLGTSQGPPECQPSSSPSPPAGSRWFLDNM